MMARHTRIVLAVLFVSAASAMARDDADAGGKYQALKCPAPDLGTTWTILDRDGGHREVEPYLSSLGQGESGTGVISSPPFVIAGDTIRFTIRGHDGQGGGRGENFIALVDARKGNILLKTEAPGADALQERSWDVAKWRGTETWIEVRDGNQGGAYAWLGVGRIDAPGSLNIDFRQGMPKGWEVSKAEAAKSYETLVAGIPFKRNTATFSVIPQSGQVELPCGFAAGRIFLLGCTVSRGDPGATYGRIEIRYRNGAPDVIPLVYGVTLDGRYKQLSRSTELRLHPSADPYQPYLAITPRDETIEMIRLAADSVGGEIPRITAVTCQTDADSPQLTPLPKSELSDEEAKWIASHAISAD